MGKKNIYEIVWSFISIIGIYYTYNIYNDYLNLEKKGYTINAVVSEDFSTGSKSGGVLFLSYIGKEYSIEVPKRIGKKYTKGMSINVYYSKRYDSLYLPDMSTLYQRYLYAAIISLCLSLLPWTWIQAKLRSKT